MDLVERELDWVLHSPSFYSAAVLREAESELVSDKRITLPGPVVASHQLEPLDTEFSRNLLSDPSKRLGCLAELAREIPRMASGRLGLRFEQYLYSILRAHFGEDNVLSRVAVREKLSTGEIKTWGEFDFLLLDREHGRLEHWESSVKFYLQVKDDSDWFWCWGPGVVDRLDLKGPKTFLQQLMLSSTECGQKAIPESWRKYPLIKRVFAKGTVFYRWSPAKETFQNRLKHLTTPHGLAEDHLKSWWIHPAEVAALKEHFSTCRIVVLPRLTWMTGVDCSSVDAHVFETWEQFEAALEQRCLQASARRECLFVGLYSDAEPPKLCSQGFIVTQHFLAAFAQLKHGNEHE